jgi:hypothetical protein
MRQHQPLIERLRNALQGIEWEAIFVELKIGIHDGGMHPQGSARSGGRKPKTGGGGMAGLTNERTKLSNLRDSAGSFCKRDLSDPMSGFFVVSRVSLDNVVYPLSGTRREQIVRECRFPSTSRSARQVDRQHDPRPISALRRGWHARASGSSNGFSLGCNWPAICQCGRNDVRFPKMTPLRPSATAVCVARVCF